MNLLNKLVIAKSLFGLANAGVLEPNIYLSVVTITSFAISISMATSGLSFSQ
jgi:hypothetical protein